VTLSATNDFAVVRGGTVAGSFETRAETSPSELITNRAAITGNQGCTDTRHLQCFKTTRTSGSSVFPKSRRTQTCCFQSGYHSAEHQRLNPAWTPQLPIDAQCATHGIHPTTPCPPAERLRTLPLVKVGLKERCLPSRRRRGTELFETGPCVSHWKNRAASLSLSKRRQLRKIPFG